MHSQGYIDYDNNCRKDGDDTRSKTSGSSTKGASQVDEIIRSVIEEMQQLYGPPREMRKFVEKPHYCSVYGGDHLAVECLPMKSLGGVRQNPHMAY